VSGRSSGAAAYIAPAKEIIAAFPPRRSSAELRQTSHGTFTIPDSKIRRNILPPTVTVAEGVKLVRPAHWY